MKPHHTKDKGDLGVLKAQCDLFEQGFALFVPLSEHYPFDVVAYRDGEFRRVQVKYRAVDQFGKVDIKFSSSWSDRFGTHSIPVEKSEIDIYCVYCPDTDECYYLRPEDFGSNVSLRVEAPKNNQFANIHFAADFRRVP